jgi:hypothetical protein
MAELDSCVFTYNTKKNLVNKISKLSKNEHIELFRIIYNNNAKHTINNNGVFINMNTLDDDILVKIDQFINFCINNTELLNKQENYINNEKNKFLNHDTNNLCDIENISIK